MNRFAYAAATALALLSIQPAAAQSLRGVRGDVAIGVDQFYSEGNHDSNVAYQGALGVDTFIGDDFVLGVEGTFLWATPENETVDGGGVASRKSFQELAVAVRAGVMVAPSTLIYGKLGYGVNEQRKRFEAFTPLGSYYNHYKTNGWIAGGGIEQMLSDRFYLKGEARYANYRTNSARLTGLIGVGVLFGPSVKH